MTRKSGYHKNGSGHAKNKSNFRPKPPTASALASEIDLDNSTLINLCGCNKCIPCLIKKADKENDVRIKSANL